MARPKNGGKAVISMKDVEADLAHYAQDNRARLAPEGGNQISIRGGRYAYKQEVIGAQMRVIVVDFIRANAWFDVPFDPDNPHPPACTALSIDGESMQPVEGCPAKQNDYCDGCEQNAWGTADIGRGKACANQYRLGCIEPDGDPLESELATLTVPPTSKQNWEKFIRGLDVKANLPCFGVVTLMGFDPSIEHPVITMEVDHVIDDAGKLKAIMSRIEATREELMQPPDFSGYEGPSKAPRARKKPATKKRAAKKKPATKRKPQVQPKVTKKRGTRKKASARSGKSKFSA